ncbi:MAG: GtrA family protein [Alphaproteobacteria bacterium]|nr:GtrA family protein [Alphaproteobacteria bacterium]
MGADGLAGQFLRFSVVGAAGFAVDSGVLYGLMYGLGAGPYLGRAGSFLAAASVTWFLNRIYTFRQADRADAHRQWARFVAFMVLGGLVNYGVYAAVVALAPPHPLVPLLGVAAGSVAGLAVNFTTSRLFVFRAVSRP